MIGIVIPEIDVMTAAGMFVGKIEVFANSSLSQEDNMAIKMTGRLNHAYFFMFWLIIVVIVFIDAKI